MSGDASRTLAEIREIYFRTTPATIARDFDRAIDLAKSIDNESDREKASVYMEGLAELRREFRPRRRPRS
jgi:hypothetical protein